MAGEVTAGISREFHPLKKGHNYYFLNYSKKPQAIFTAKTLRVLTV